MRLALGSAAVVVLVGASTAATATSTPRNDFKVVLWKRIGPFVYLKGVRNGGAGTYREAVAAFGRPSARGSTYRSNICTVRWNHLGMDFGFVPSSSPCKDGSLRNTGWYDASLYDGRWTTSRGLSVGDSIVRLRALYPKARFYNKPPEPPVWALVTVPHDGGPLAVLSATVWSGHVTSLELNYPTVF
jgi:hypothetical protein